MRKMLISSFKYVSERPAILGAFIALFAEHHQAKTYRLTGSIDGTKKIADGCQKYLEAKEDNGKKVAIYQIREGLSVISRTSNRWSIIDSFKSPVKFFNSCYKDYKKPSDSTYDDEGLSMDKIIHNLEDSASKEETIGSEDRALELLKAFKSK